MQHASSTSGTAQTVNMLDANVNATSTSTMPETVPAAAPVAAASGAIAPEAMLPNGRCIVADPSLMLNSLDMNDDMKNVMMSWYYAGYYTGRLQGRQESPSANKG